MDNVAKVPVSVKAILEKIKQPKLILQKLTLPIGSKGCRLHPCIFCQEKFLSREELANHLSLYHRIELPKKLKHISEQGTTPFRTTTSSSEAESSVAKPYQCFICALEFYETDVLNLHLQFVHKASVAKVKRVAKKPPQSTSSSSIKPTSLISVSGIPSLSSKKSALKTALSGIKIIKTVSLSTLPKVKDKDANLAIGAGSGGEIKVEESFKQEEVSISDNDAAMEDVDAGSDGGLDEDLSFEENEGSSKRRILSRPEASRPPNRSGKSLTKPQLKNGHQLKSDPVECHVCGKIVPQGRRFNINNHLRLEHSPSPGTQCEHCQEENIFFFIGDIERHQFDAHKVPFKCGFCDQKFCHEKLRQAHINRTLHRCTICNKEVQFIDSHMVRQHLNLLECHLCHKRMARHPLLLHLERHQRLAGPRQFLCTNCGKIFRLKSELNSHERAFHSKECDKVICEICGLNCPDKGSLRAHMNREHNGQSFNCPGCDEIFRDKTVFHEHLSTHSLKTYSCDQCGRAFKSKAKLQRHLGRVHTGQNCSFCGKLFMLRYDLRQHVSQEHRKVVIKQVKPGQPSVCELCGKELKTYKLLVAHIKNVHEKISNFKCDFCIKAFRSNAHLIRHKFQVHKIDPKANEKETARATASIS